MLAVIVVITLLFTAALLAMVREAAQLKKSLAMLDRRVAALELENATTTVIEPEPTPPRSPNALLN